MSLQTDQVDFILSLSSLLAIDYSLSAKSSTGHGVFWSFFPLSVSKHYNPPITLKKIRTRRDKGVVEPGSQFKSDLIAPGFATMQVSSLRTKLHFVVSCGQVVP